MVVCVKVTKDAMKNYTLLRFRALTLRPNKIESIEPWWKFCEVPRRNALTFREKFLHIFLFSRPLFRSLFVFENQKSKETNNRLLVPETKWSIKIAAWWRLFFDLFPFPEQQVIITAKGVEFHVVNYWEHKGCISETVINRESCTMFCFYFQNCRDVTDHRKLVISKI